MSSTFGLPPISEPEWFLFVISSEARNLFLTEHCCQQLQQAVDGDAILNQPMQQMRGRILNEIDSDYAARSPEDRPNLYPMNFCPFCGRAISRTIWNAEKKK
jgi:hypothetical protein